MPRRTNYRQQIIELLEGMNAGPDCTVTPSKMLRDRHSGIEREVDVVVERVIDRETITWSFEVRDHKRRATVEWVDAMVGKHEGLPTDLLFLVSWSGFYGSAERHAATMPRLRLCTPRVVPGREGPGIKSIRVGTIQLVARETRIGFDRPDGSNGWIRSEPDIGIYTEAKDSVCVAQQLTEQMVHDPRVGPLVREQWSQHPERDDLKSFDLWTPMDKASFYLYEQDLDELQRITLLEVLGDFRFAEKRLDMEIRELRGQPFAYGIVELADANATFVTRLNEALDISGGIARFEMPKT